MSQPGAPEPKPHRHGNIFSRDSGSMLIHIQRESGLAHRTLSLAPWQVQVLRVVTTRWFAMIIVAGLASWVFFAVQAARVPLLSSRLARMEVDARRLDTLQQALTRLQERYDQVQHMLSAPSVAATTPVKQGTAKPVRSTADSQRIARPSAAARRADAKARGDSAGAKHPSKSDSVAKQKVP